ncbi:MAG: hypothetical protein ACYTG6_01950 [Planctomycetota bacterium]|jgi:hypothetical protein
MNARPRFRSSTRFFVAVAAIVVVAGGVVLIGRGRQPTRETGVTVRLTVVNERGEPVPDARVQRRFAPGWKRIERDGRLHLEDVVLRSGESPSPAAVAAALDVEAPHHALPPGRSPEVASAPDGSWSARYVLASFGVLRLRVAPTTLRGVRAWAEAARPEDRVVPADVFTVARANQPAAWRVFDGATQVRVRLVGDMGVAAQVEFLDAPAAGFVRQFALTPRRATPIHGRVLLPPEPPPAVGQLDVWEVTAAGTEVALPSVVVRFEVPYTGERRYRLQARLGFLDPPRDLLVRGGTEALMEGAVARPWIRVDPQGWEVPLEGARIRVQAHDGEPRRVDLPHPHGAVQHDGSLYAALPGPGTYDVIVEGPGSADRAPWRAAGRVEATAPLEWPVVLSPEPVPHGDVLVRLSGALAEAGATVDVLEPFFRTISALPGLGREVSIPNVRAGRVRVRVSWRAGGAAVSVLEGRLAETGRPLALEAVARPGGTVAFGVGIVPLGLGPADLVLVADRGDTPYGDAALTLRILWSEVARRYETAAPLLPGRYDARFEHRSDGGTHAHPVVFEIREGEDTFVSAEAE